MFRGVPDKGLADDRVQAGIVFFPSFLLPDFLLGNGGFQGFFPPAECVEFAVRSVANH
jgi:hypothetical protein